MGERGKRGPNKPRPFIIDGKKKMCFSVGMISDKSGYTSQWLRKLMDDGVISCSHTDAHGRNWWTPKDMAQTLKVLKQRTED